MNHWRYSHHCAGLCFAGLCVCVLERGIFKETTLRLQVILFLCFNDSTQKNRRCSGSLGIGNISKTFPIRFDCDSSEKEKQSEERAARELFLEEPNRKSVSACQRASVQSRFELY